MTDRAEIERLLNQTGRTLEGLPEHYGTSERVDFLLSISQKNGWFSDKILHKSDVIELLVGALRDLLDKPMQKPLTLHQLSIHQGKMHKNNKKLKSMEDAYEETVYQRADEGPHRGEHSQEHAEDAQDR